MKNVKINNREKFPNIKLENRRKIRNYRERDRERERERERERDPEKTEHRFAGHGTEDRRGRGFAETVASNTKISNTVKDKTNRLLSTG